MPHVFISYARKEPRWAARLDADLMARGYKTWRDTRDIDPEQDFTAEIEIGIREASHLVVCLTQDVRRENSFVRRELQYALNQDAQRRQCNPEEHLPLVPVVFPGGELPVHISTWTALFLQDDARYGDLFDKLLTRLERPVQPNQVPIYQDSPQVVAYLRKLHHWCSEQLLRSTMHLLSIGARATQGVVETRHDGGFKVGFRVSPASALVAGAKPAPDSFVSINQAMARYGRRLMLLGAPGAGKTTTILSLARDAAVARLSDPAQPLPILASIHLWDHHRDLVGWIADVSPWPAAKSERPFYLLDGLDELGGLRPIDPANPREGMYDPRKRFLDYIARDLPSGPLVITCREWDFFDIGHRAPLDAALTLNQLTKEQIRKYLLARGQASLWARVEADVEFAELVRTPLLLGMLSVAVGDDAQAFEDVGAPLDEVFIFDRYVTRRFLHEAARPGKLGYSEVETRAQLAAIALQMWIEPDTPGTLSGIWFPVQKQIVSYAQLEAVFGPHVKEFLDFCKRMHLLRADRNGAMNFVHLKLRDFCALPALFQIVAWSRTGGAPPRDNALWIDVDAYPADFAWDNVAGSIGGAARDALSIIGGNGMDLVTGYRRTYPEAALGDARERRRRYKSSPELNIPDDDAQGVADVIVVPDAGRVVDLSVYIDVDHQWVGDLKVALQPPVGQPVLLHDRTGGSRNALGVSCSVLDPEVAKVRGRRSDGRWTLRISDHARMDQGRLVRWELDLRIEPDT